MAHDVSGERVTMRGLKCGYACGLLLHHAWSMRVFICDHLRPAMFDAVAAVGLGACHLSMPTSSSSAG